MGAAFGFAGYVLMLIGAFFGARLIFRQIKRAGMSSGMPANLLDAIIAEPWSPLPLTGLLLLAAGTFGYLLRHALELGQTALRDGPTITIDRNGIFDRRTMRRPAAWGAIDRITLEKYRHHGKTVKEVLVSTKAVDRGLKLRLGLDFVLSVLPDGIVPSGSMIVTIQMEAEALHRLLLAEAQRYGWGPADA